jgi:hypothetical protein
MKQEDKELLLKDLCTRLPYGVICNDNRHGSSRVTYIDITPDDIEQKNGKVVVYYFDFDECGELKNCKPYLRPMSSMTEDEEKEYYELYYNAPQFKNGWRDMRYLEGLHVDWLNAHHFDYRGLIEKGLAIAVTEENNPYKE